MKLIREVLGGALKSVQLDSVAHLAAINSNWESIVGVQLAKVSAPSAVLEKKLIVEVFDSAFIEPLEYARWKIKDRIVAELGRCTITTVKIEYKEKA